MDTTILVCKSLLASPTILRHKILCFYVLPCIAFLSFSFSFAQDQLALPDGQSFEEGDVVSLVASPEGASTLVRTSVPYDSQSVGVVVYTPEFQKAVQYQGTVLIRVSAERGAVFPGDLLATTAQSGVVAKALQSGNIIGVALQGYSSFDPQAVGVISVLLRVGYNNLALPPAEDPSTTTTPQQNPEWANPLIDLGTLTVRDPQSPSLYGDRLDIGNGKVTIDASGNISTVGSLIITGNITTIGDAIFKNLFVFDDITTRKLVAPAYDNLTLKLGDQYGVNSLEITDSLGIPKMTVSSEGSLKAQTGLFSHLFLQGEGEKKTSGKAILLGGQTAAFVPCSAISDDSQIHITPIGSTANQTLFIESQRTGQGFTVGVDHPLSRDVALYYLVIN